MKGVVREASLMGVNAFLRWWCCSFSHGQVFIPSVHSRAHGRKEEERMGEGELTIARRTWARERRMRRKETKREVGETSGIATLLNVART